MKKEEKEKVMEDEETGETEEHAADGSPHNAVKRKNIFTIIKAVVLAVVVIGIPLYLVVFHRDLFTTMNSLDDAVKTLKSFDSWTGRFLYLTLQILQIIISVLPGQVFQIAAGMVFGVLQGLLLSFIGALLGTTLVYFIARGLGQDAMELILGAEKSARLVKMLNSERSYAIIFLFYLIPGLPKDLMAYAAGISEVHFRAFLVLSTVGRIPAMTISLFFGKMLLRGNRQALIIIGILVAAVMILALIFRKQISAFSEKIYHKLSS